MKQIKKFIIVFFLFSFETKIHSDQNNILIKVDNKIIVSLGVNQGLRRGKAGIVPPNGNDMNMNDWIVVTVKNTNGDFSEIEPLNPNNENDVIEGKFIKFLK